MEEKIDFVLIWVDGSDPKWLEEKAKYSDNPESVYSTANRYRDWELLRYWFRGVEKFAPWVNNVYFITCGHYPEWLNFNHPKLKFVKHEDYIPKEYLPTFSSHPIELNLHRIEGLNNCFVYFNDDMFITNNVNKIDFFKKRLPRYIACNDINYSDNYNDNFPRILLNNIAIINKFFNKKDVIKKDFRKWYNHNYPVKLLLKNIVMTPFNKFSTIYNEHLPSPILKSTINEIWSKEKDLLESVSLHKFRSKEDVNQYLFKWYDIARGNFEPAKMVGKYFSVSEEYDELLNAIEMQKYKMICISDDMAIDFEKAKKDVQNAFGKILPEKSEYEI